MSILDRVLLLLTGLLAAYQVAVGINGLAILPMTAYTVGFGVLIVAGLLLIILGFEVMDANLVVLLSTVIPLSLSLGLVAEYLQQFCTLYLIFVILSLLAIGITRYKYPGKIAVLVLIIVHGVAGLLIFGLPILLVAQKVKPVGFLLVAVGGGLIGVGGLLLSFLKTGKPILSQEMIHRVLPGLLLLMTASFVAGFAFS